MISGLLSMLFLLAPAKAEVVVLELDGMNCESCEKKLSDALNTLDFLDGAQASTPGGKACAELTGALDTSAITAVVTDLGYSLTAQDLLDECPDISASSRPGNWADVGDLDASIISRGERFELDAHLVQSKFTVFDFGAIWCGPCHTAEKVLKLYMADHSDVAVRAVVLKGRDPKASFAQPVVRQHLATAPGLPYFLVYSPQGTLIYRGVDTLKVLKKIDRKRK